jgi:Pyruvate/2-oxoacid:ferredoxin oxidoreductase delta subunit
MDGIMSMQGNGPRGGTPAKTNVLLFSSDPVALDATVCRIINLNPEYVPTIIYGQEAGLGTYLEENIQLVGDRLEDFKNTEFDVKREPVRAYKPGKAIQVLRAVRNHVVPKPHINEDRCVKCGVCVNVCPVSPKALDWHDGVKSKAPAYLYSRCIRCYCCQELCPEGAIHLKVPYLRRLLGMKG